MERRLREEEYKGGGAAVTWTSGAWEVVGDLSYSESHRTELQKATNMRSATRVSYLYDRSADEVPSVTFTNFDITDPDNFLIPTPANNTTNDEKRCAKDMVRSSIARTARPAIRP